MLWDIVCEGIDAPVGEALARPAHWSEVVSFDPVSAVSSVSTQLKGSTQVATFKLPVGRPTKYEPRFDDELLDAMSRGYSLTAFAGEIGVSRYTLDNWASSFPSFMEAVSRGRAARLKYWESKLINVGETGGVGQMGTVTIFALKNASASMGASEWLDKQEVTHSGQVTLAALVESSLKTLPSPVVEHDPNEGNES